MFKHILINTLLASAIFVFQIAFVSGFLYPISEFNIILIVLIFVLVLGNFELALYFSIGLGFLADIFSFLPFGFYLIILPLLTIGINFLFSNFFTNRSLYSFLSLGILGSLIYDVLIFIGRYLISLFENSKINFSLVSFSSYEVHHLLLNSTAIVILFYITSYINKKLKPEFLGY